MEERVSKEEIEAEDAVSLPNKEVLSLLDVNANVDLGLDLAAPVDLAAAANLNVAAPIEAAATANVLSEGAQAVGYADQQGTIGQGIDGTAHAVAPQQASVDQEQLWHAGHAGGAGLEHPGRVGGLGYPGRVSGLRGHRRHERCGRGGRQHRRQHRGRRRQRRFRCRGQRDRRRRVAAQRREPARCQREHPRGRRPGGADRRRGGGQRQRRRTDRRGSRCNVGSPDAVSEALAPQNVDISQKLDHVTADAEADQNANVQQQ